MPLRQNTFLRQERLKSRKVISGLFKGAHSFSAYPIRPVWCVLEKPTPFPIQITLTVPKKVFPHAVDRNRIRRQMREAFRLQKNNFYSALAAKSDTRHYGIILIYTAKEALPYADIEAGVKKMIKKFLAWEEEKS